MRCRRPSTARASQQPAQVRTAGPAAGVRALTWQCANFCAPVQGRLAVTRSAAMSGPVFWRGRNTARVPMSMYAENRERVVAAMRRAAAASGAPLGVALLQGGAQVQRHETDHEELFRQARAQEAMP